MAISHWAWFLFHFNLKLYLYYIIAVYLAVCRQLACFSITRCLIIREKNTVFCDKQNSAVANLICACFEWESDEVFVSRNMETKYRLNFLTKMKRRRKNNIVKITVYYSVFMIQQGEIFLTIFIR